MATMEQDCSFVCLFWVARAIFQLSGDCLETVIIIITGDGAAILDLFSAYGFYQW
jgi:hypothetical protein